MLTYASKLNKPAETILSNSPRVTNSTWNRDFPPQIQLNKEQLDKEGVKSLKLTQKNSSWINKAPSSPGELARPWIQPKLTAGKQNFKSGQEKAYIARKFPAPTLSSCNNNSHHGNIPPNKIGQPRSVLDLTNQQPTVEVLPASGALASQPRSNASLLERSYTQISQPNFTTEPTYAKNQTDNLNHPLIFPNLKTKKNIISKKDIHQQVWCKRQKFITHKSTQGFQPVKGVIERRRMHQSQPEFHISIRHTSASNRGNIVQAGGQLGKEARRIKNRYDQPNEEGGGIWLTETNAANGRHQQVRIGETKQNAYAQSYGLKENPESMFELWNPSVSTGPREGGQGKAAVYIDLSKPTETVQFFPMSKEEQNEAKEQLKKELGQEGKYSLLSYNCVHYSKNTFDWIKKDTMEKRSGKGGNEIPKPRFDFKFDDL